MRRRCALLGLLLLGLAAGPAQAQRGAGKPPPLELRKQPSIPLTQKSGAPLNSTIAPVPDRSKEAPRTIQPDRARIDPSIINRPLPGRGAVDQGEREVLEDKLFKPAPGARLNVPFSY
ncbi:hypothetical protein [Roseicella frigidaeris]|uniref:Uncharacterized protein n=1 Tax=Roseicella frigidaeris TaxID=2230885 RepID=A0A327MF26_9PROT|nr:hypothetical protein [Roseicella frigidaeris]RAI61016.1 hypothetical protein DOO78_02500 [Roseicella frigidaeris]